MLMVGSDMLNMPVLSFHVGGQIAVTDAAIIDPEDLSVRAYHLGGPLIASDPEIGDVLDTRDIREVGTDGAIIDSTDVLVTADQVMRIKEILDLNFDLIGLKVVTKQGKKLGKVVDYTIDSSTFSIYQIIVQRPFMESFLDPQLTINRSQIIELDDYTITIKHDKQNVKVPKVTEAKEKAQDLKQNFENPFRDKNILHEKELAEDQSGKQN